MASKMAITAMTILSQGICVKMLSYRSSTCL